MTHLQQLALNIPKKQRRRLREFRFDGQVASARIYSLTNQGTEEDHVPVISLPTGFVFCTCKDYEHRRQHNGEACKHLLRLMAAVERRIQQMKKGVYLA